MPSTPLRGANGNLFDLTHASLHHTAQRAVAEPGNVSNGHEIAHAVLPRGLSNFNSINATAILAMNQQHVLQVVATTTSSLSLLSALCAVYWFCMMRRNFRRDLVLLLIAGGSWKSLWFVTFSIKTFVSGTVLTETAFCQAAGYMLQVGFELCGECAIM